MPADGTLHQRNGKRISENFFEGEPGVDGYERDQQSFGYQFEHRFNDVFTARQNFRYLDSQVTNDQVYRSEEHTSELQSLMRISYAVFCLKKKNKKNNKNKNTTHTQISLRHYRIQSIVLIH